MAKLSDVLPKDEMEGMLAKWDAMSEEERETQMAETIADFKKSIGGASFKEMFSGLSSSAPIVELSELPSIDSPFQKILDVLLALHAEQKKTTKELASANNAAKTAKRIASWTLTVATLALLTNLLPVQDGIARLWRWSLTMMEWLQIAG